MKPLKHIIIEGVDRLGKDTLIQGIQDRLGFFQEIHYQKPKCLTLYHQSAMEQILRSDPGAAEDLPGLDWDTNVQSLQTYQENSFRCMFHLLTVAGRLILNRAHLGEAVYAPRYRHYDGNYVFELERKFADQGSEFDRSTLLVLLTTSDFSFMRDDGQSFDFNKKEEEQEDFKRAFNRSMIKNKLLVDVSNGSGGYRSREEILNQVLDGYDRK